MGREQWAYYRRGVMQQSKVDYTNYQKTFDPDVHDELHFKRTVQWNEAYQKISKEEIQSENKFRQAAFNKFKEDIIAHKKAK